MRRVFFLGGGVSTPHQAGEKMYRAGGEKGEKRKKMGKIRQNRKNEAKNKKKRRKIEKTLEILLKIGTYRLKIVSYLLY